MNIRHLIIIWSCEYSCYITITVFQKLKAIIDVWGSGVARVPCALGQEMFLRFPSTKTIKFEVKNRFKSAEEAKAKHMLYFFLQG